MTSAADDHPDDEAGQVEVVTAVQVGQLGRLAADQRDARGRTGGGDAAPRSARRRRPADAPTREVVEEEERVRALHRDVVDAVVDQVDPDAVVSVERDGQLQLGADAIGRCDQDRVRVRARVEPKEAAEASDAAHDRGGGG